MLMARAFEAEDAVRIAEDMSQPDVEEARQLKKSPDAQYVRDATVGCTCWTWFQDDRPVGVVGVVGCEDGGRWVWTITTEWLRSHPATLCRLAVSMLSFLGPGALRAAVPTHNLVTLRWLGHLGFHVRGFMQFSGGTPVVAILEREG